MHRRLVAKKNGNATFNGRVPADPLTATQVVIEIVYHFGGQTHGAAPNHGEFKTQGPSCRSSFGENAMRQLLILQKQ